MTAAHLIIAGLTAIASIAGVWIRWKLSQAKKDRVARLVAEQQAIKFKQAIKNNIEKNEEMQNKISEINAGVNDDRANAIMRERPKATGKLPRSITSKNRRNKH